MRRYLAVAAALLALLAGCGGGLGGRHAVRSVVVRRSPASSEAGRAVRAGRAGPGRRRHGVGRLSQSDAVAPVQEDGTAATPIAVGRTPLRLLELDGSLWVTTIRDGGLTEVDPQSGRSPAP